MSLKQIRLGIKHTSELNQNEDGYRWLNIPELKLSVEYDSGDNQFVVWEGQHDSLYSTDHKEVINYINSIQEDK